VRPTLLQAEEVMVVPRISAGTLNAWEATQHRLEKYLSLDKISKADGLNVTSVLELSGVGEAWNN
jgi:hypothetical protein